MHRVETAEYIRAILVPFCRAGSMWNMDWT